MNKICQASTGRAHCREYVKKKGKGNSFFCLEFSTAKKLNNVFASNWNLS